VIYKRPQNVYKHTLWFSAPIAQLDRASDYESGGRAFESLWVRHSFFL
jgi:hypothetical protein